MASGLARPSPARPKAVPCAGVVIGTGIPPSRVTPYALVKPKQLGRDLTLVVMHGNDPLIAFLLNPQKNGIRVNRNMRCDPGGPQILQDVDFAFYIRARDLLGLYRKGFEDEPIRGYLTV